MLCPICKTELVIGEQKRLETIEHHVCDPNGSIPLTDSYHCPYHRCIGSKHFMWSRDGDLYIKDYMNYVDMNQIKFIDGLTSAIDSQSRKIEVEVDKNDENYTLLKIGKLKFMIEFSYVANRMGEVIKRRRHLAIYTKVDGGYARYRSGIRMLIFCVREFHWQLKRDGDNYQYEHDAWDKRWWKRLSKWYIRAYFKLRGKTLIAKGERHG